MKFWTTKEQEVVIRAARNHETMAQARKELGYSRTETAVSTKLTELRRKGVVALNAKLKRVMKIKPANDPLFLAGIPRQERLVFDSDGTKKTYFGGTDKIKSDDKVEVKVDNHHKLVDKVVFPEVKVNLQLVVLEQIRDSTQKIKDLLTTVVIDLAIVAEHFIPEKPKEEFDAKGVDPHEIDVMGE